jgi:16S rRNA (guanine966-N2)-methyltransferase
MSNPRIISGTARGIHLKGVPGNITRPITDRVKEALFNILGIDIRHSSFLDLFGGTGSVGIEALSRGADHVRFIDVNQAAVRVIKDNLVLTRLQKNADVVQMDAFKFLQKPPDEVYDYVYIAPPQYKELWKQALINLESNPGWLAEDAWVMVQIDPIEYEEVELTLLKEFDKRKYGSTLLVFYMQKESEE